MSIQRLEPMQVPHLFFSWVNKDLSYPACDKYMKILMVKNQYLEVCHFKYIIYLSMSMSCYVILYPISKPQTKRVLTCHSSATRVSLFALVNNEIMGHLNLKTNGPVDNLASFSCVSWLVVGWFQSPPLHNLGWIPCDPLTDGAPGDISKDTFLGPGRYPMCQSRPSNLSGGCSSGSKLAVPLVAVTYLRSNSMM